MAGRRDAILVRGLRGCIVERESEGEANHSVGSPRYLDEVLLVAEGVTSVWMNTKDDGAGGAENLQVPPENGLSPERGRPGTHSVDDNVKMPDERVGDRPPAAP